MAKYHLNPRTGEPGVCKAERACPFGDLTLDHYGSKKDARTAYEAMNSSFGATAVPATFTHEGVAFDNDIWIGTYPNKLPIYQPCLVAHGRMFSLTHDNLNDKTSGYHVFVSHKTSSGWYSVSRDYGIGKNLTLDQARQLAEDEAMRLSREKLAANKATASRTLTDDEVKHFWAEGKQKEWSEYAY